jgi:DNA-binding transcriptional ArsR family regulator
MLISAYDDGVARAATTADTFNAIAEASRRDILTALKHGEASVGEIVDAVGLTQPQVSKHLGVLRTVDLVRCRTVGRRHLYRVNGHALRPVHDWVAAFEAHWNERLDRLEDLLTELQQEDTP